MPSMLWVSGAANAPSGPILGASGEWSAWALVLSSSSTDVGPLLGASGEGTDGAVVLFVAFLGAPLGCMGGSSSSDVGSRLPTL